MADPVPSVFSDKRRVLYGKGMEKRLAGVAATLVAADRLSEALEFLERRREPAALEEVRRRAVAVGDTFALQRAAQLLRIEPDPGEWRETADRAEAGGRYYDAIRALERAGDTERAEALRIAHHPDYAPFKPAGK